MASRPSPGNLPPGYPAEYRQRVVLPDGRRLLIRPVLPADGVHLLAVLQSMDTPTMQRTFPEQPSGPPEARVRAILDADYHDRFALIAYDVHGAVVGMSRYERVPGTDTAVLRLAVAPSWRRAGIGRELLWSLATRAQQCGISSFTGLSRPDNQAFHALVGQSGGVLDVRDDVATVSMVIDWSRAPS
jgi:GNAT superfamily N-acetyltransferase